MRILQVIHGYPPHYMAGSEVYTWNLARELARGHEVHVFTRVENPWEPPYRVWDSVEDGIAVRRVNKPSRDYTFRDKYLDPEVDAVFRRTIKDVRPDLVHFGHLSHLSTQLPAIARREHGIPTVLTIHDFWMFCYRGQLVRPDLQLCDGPTEDACLACARHFYKDWIDRTQVAERGRHMQDVVDAIDAFLAPSETVASFFRREGVPAGKIHLSPYGFDTSRVTRRNRLLADGPLRFGFMGRVIPVKGVRELLKAFIEVSGPATLDIWGDLGGQRPWLENLAGGDPRIGLRGGFHNGEIEEVLAGMDVLVAPSVWLENAPLVIQEAMLAGIPVITSDAGGMAELVTHGEDGLLVPLGDTDALRKAMQGLVDDPARAEVLRPDGRRVRTIEDDAAACLSLYSGLLPTRRNPVLPLRPAPWRVTFVTNPGLCNLACPMCDTHSPFAPGGQRNLPLLPFDLIERTVSELAPMGLREIIPSTMGEPLLYPRFRELLELAALWSVKVNLTTNGTFPQGEVDAWAEALLPVVSDVKFSVNGIDPAVVAEVMPGLDPEQQLADIRRYLARKKAREMEGRDAGSVTLQATFMEANLHELPRILRWAIKSNVDRFKGHHLWVNWPELAEQSLRRAPDSRRRWNEMVSTLQQIAEEERRPNGRRIRLDNVELLGAKSQGDHGVCPFLGREAWIEADGSFQVCCCPSQERRDFGAFGRLADARFMELWNSKQYRDFVAGWGDHPNCRRCNMRRPAEEVSDA